jgi:hypothetical protein
LIVTLAGAVNVAPFVGLVIEQVGFAANATDAIIKKEKQALISRFTRVVFMAWSPVMLAWFKVPGSGLRRLALSGRHLTRLRRTFRLRQAYGQASGQATVNPEP